MTPKVLGITAEYDPFHKGHKFQLEEAVRRTGADVKIAVISGNFTQRGEPAILDKWARAEMAVREGFDLVVEMPLLFALSSSGDFAKAGVEILEDMGADYISFGSECGDLRTLQEAAFRRDMMTEEEEEGIRQLVREGYSYPRALQTVLMEAEPLGPNDNLACEYIRNIKTAQPVVIKREGAGYSDMESGEGYPSAMQIRELLKKHEDVSDLMPEASFLRLKEEEKNCGLMFKEMLFPLLMEKIATTPKHQLMMISGAGEGLGNKLRDSFRYCHDYDELAASIKSKRYTLTRVQRVLANTLLGIREEDAAGAVNYIRVLAFNDRGSAYLRTVDDRGHDLPLITNINKDALKYPELQKDIERDILATDIYNIALGRDLYLNSEYVKKPLKLSLL